MVHLPNLSVEERIASKSPVQHHGRDIIGLKQLNHPISHPYVLYQHTYKQIIFQHYLVSAE